MCEIWWVVILTNGQANRPIQDIREMAEAGAGTGRHLDLPALRRPAHQRQVRQLLGMPLQKNTHATLTSSRSRQKPTSMVKQNPRLELTWIGKDKRPKLEPRILLEENDGKPWRYVLVPHDEVAENRDLSDYVLNLK